VVLLAAGNPSLRHNGEAWNANPVRLSLRQRLDDGFDLFARFRPWLRSCRQTITEPPDRNTTARQSEDRYKLGRRAAEMRLIVFVRYGKPAVLKL
jgi:hypothetical protein